MAARRAPGRDRGRHGGLHGAALRGGAPWAPDPQEPFPLAQLPDGAQRALVARERRARRRRGPHGALLGRLGDEARHGGRHRASQALRRHADVPAALAAYEAERRPEVESLQRAAQVSLEWFETTERYRRLEPIQFAMTHLTRSLRVTHENLKVRDPRFVATVDRWFAEGAARQSGVPRRDGPAAPADVHAVPAAGPRRCRTASSCRRCASTRPRTARRTTGISSISAAGPPAARRWSSPR